MCAFSIFHAVKCFTLCGAYAYSCVDCFPCNTSNDGKYYGMSTSALSLSFSLQSPGITQPHTGVQTKEDISESSVKENTSTGSGDTIPDVAPEGDAIIKTQSKSKESYRPNQNRGPFSCHLCPWTFPCNSDFIAHMRTHTGEKPFKCSICSSSFGRKSDMSRHMIAHSHTAEKLFKCTVCSRCFGRQSNLTNHMIIHPRERPFVCSVCQSRFSTKQKLDDHFTVHLSTCPD